MKFPSLREPLEVKRELFGVLLFSFGGGWRIVACVPVNTAPQEGQLRLFSVTGAEQTGQVFMGEGVYRVIGDLHNYFERGEGGHVQFELRGNAAGCEGAASVREADDSIKPGAPAPGTPYQT